MKKYLMHHGVLDQKWGVRRWQNEDGSLTPEGYEHYYGRKRRVDILNKLERQKDKSFNYKYAVKNGFKIFNKHYSKKYVESTKKVNQLEKEFLDSIPEKDKKAIRKVINRFNKNLEKAFAKEQALDKKMYDGEPINAELGTYSNKVTAQYFQDIGDIGEEYVYNIKAYELERLFDKYNL